MSNSTNSTDVPLSYLTTRECSTRSVAFIYSRFHEKPPTAWVPMNEDTWNGLSQICDPELIYLYGCTMWCELPWDFQKAFEASGQDKISNYFRMRMKDTGMNISSMSTWSVSSDGPASVRPPSLAALVSSVLLATTVVGLLGC